MQNVQQKSVIFSNDHLNFLKKVLQNAEYWDNKNLSTLSFVEASSLIFQISEGFVKNKDQLKFQSDYEAFIKCIRKIVQVFNAPVKEKEIKQQINDMDFSSFLQMDEQKEKLVFLLGEKVDGHFTTSLAKKLQDAEITLIEDLYLIFNEFSPLNNDYSGLILFLRNNEICSEEEIKQVVSKMKALGFNKNSFFSPSFILGVNISEKRKRPIKNKLEAYQKN